MAKEIEMNTENKKLDFNKVLKNLEGQEVKDQKNESVKLSMLLGNTLVQGAKGDALKFYHWALKLVDGKPLELDKSDESTLKEFISGNETLTILAKAQLLEQFD